MNLEQKALQFAPKAALCFGFTPVLLGECGVMVKGDAVFPLDSSRILEGGDIVGPPGGCIRVNE
jgi:hypothetical protein